MTTGNIYEDGTTVTVEGTFTLISNGSLRNPTTVTLTYRLEGGTETSDTWSGTNGAITNVSTGLFSATIETLGLTVSKNLIMQYRWGTPDPGFRVYGTGWFTIKNSDLP